MPPGPTDAQLHEVAMRHRAQEFQRQRQQGRGRPIISTEMNGIRFVAIGNELAYGRWKTFQEFLLFHAKERLGRSWGLAEMSKPEGERHPFVRWLGVLAALMRKHITDPDGINSMPDYGAARSTIGLAYDLYLIEHHVQNQRDRRSFKRLLERIKQPDQFFGARHEARVAGMLLRAGFDLAWEDEQDRRVGGHGEFVATFPQTRRSFWVECKMRQSEDNGGPAKFTHLVSAALRKQTDLERLVFVELNLAGGRMDSEGEGWPGWAVNQLRKLESQPSAAALPPALIVISNFPDHRHLEVMPDGTGAVLEGFKTRWYHMGEIVDLLEAIEEREKNPEIESLWRSMQEHASIPTTFDGSIAGVNESQRLLIGQSYELPNGDVGVLEDAIVVEHWQQATAAFRLPDGKRAMIRFDLTDDELHAWRRHPETFFGGFRPHDPPMKHSLDAFEFFVQAYSRTPKERLLEFMSGPDDIEKLRGLSQSELVKRYAYRLVCSIAQRSEAPVAPSWHRRLKRHKVPGTPSGS